MAEKLNLKPKKGILKATSSIEERERHKELTKETKWDEMNILATLHPKDKDYGHMKIEEPKTPYAYAQECDGGPASGDEADGLDADLLAQKIQLGSNELPKAMNEVEPIDESDEDESQEEKEKRHEFESKRKKHYNEYYAVKLARKLMEHDEDEDPKVDMEGDEAESRGEGAEPLDEGAEARGAGI